MVKRDVLPWIITLIAAIAYFIVMSWYTILKYLTFHTHAADLGIFSQAIATTLFYHRFFYETVDIAITPKPGPIGYSFFDIHFSPTLLLFLPFYAIYPSPVMLLILQSVIVALGALPIYWFGDKLGNKWLGTLMAILYLMNPLVQGANSFDFHMETIFMPLSLYTLYFLFARKWRPYYVFLVLSLGTIEFAPVPMFILGLYYSIANYRRRELLKHGLITMLISILFLVLALKLKQFLNPLGSTTTSPLAGLPSEYASSFDMSILLAVIKNPALIAGLYSIYGTNKFLYFLELYSPFAFLSFLDPLVLPSLAWPLASFLTSNTIYFSPYFQYSSFSIPFIVFATLRVISRFPSELLKKTAILLLIATFVVFLGVSPLIHFIYTLTNTDVEVWNAFRMIPMNETLLVQNNLFPPFSNDADAYTQWYPWIKPIYIIAQPSSSWFTWWGTPYNEYVEYALNRGYRVYIELGNSLLVLKYNYTGKPVLCKSTDLMLYPVNFTVINGAVINNALVHSYNAPPGQWFTAFLYLPPGNYDIIINYSWSGPNYLGKLNVTLAQININGVEVPLTTEGNQVNITIYMPYYSKLILTSYANYIINTTIYLYWVDIRGPLC